MTKKSRVIALKIAQIMEEYTEAEITDAIAILQRDDLNNPLIQYLGRPQTNARGKLPTVNNSKHVSPQIQNIDYVPDYLKKIQTGDKEKFAILFEIYTLMRSKKIFTTDSSLRHLSEKISKDFEMKKSRRDNIIDIIKGLSQKSTSELRSIFDKELLLTQGELGDSYQRLADFIIKGGGK